MGNQSSKKKSPPMLKYTGMAFQLAIMLGVGLLAGQWLDRYFQTARPYFTAFVPLILLVGYLIKIILEFTSAPPKDEKKAS